MYVLGEYFHFCGSFSSPPLTFPLRPNQVRRQRIKKLGWFAHEPSLSVLHLDSLGMSRERFKNKINLKVHSTSPLLYPLTKADST